MACELCGAQAALYCEPDGAFLCWPCDASVHGANFIVSRHVRRVACASCHSLEDGRLISGAGSRPIRSLCRLCNPEALPCSPSSSSTSASVASSTVSTCLSTADSIVAPLSQKSTGHRRMKTRRQRRVRQVDEIAERVLGEWSRRMGLRSGQCCVAEAAHVAGACEGETTALPSRVVLAAALWFAIKLCEEDKRKDTSGGVGGTLLRRLEACSGVPVRLIVMTESRIARATRWVGVAKEGWDECS